MATKTTNYNLIKPELTDDADIRVINGNMDVLDNQLKSISDKAGSATNNAYTNITVSSDYTWKFTKGSGANVSYDTIKNATTATALGGTKSTYKVPTDASKYSQLEYWFGTQPHKGSSTNTIDGGVLKFNHWGASNWNSAIVFGNNASYRPYMEYQNGTAGEYSVYKDLAWYDDTTNKLPLAGGTMTGAIKTSDNIYKNSNNGVLVLSGSTDATHGGRINLSGEKQTDAGLVKITADNGTISNVFEVTTAGGGSRYNFNGLTTYMNSNDDYFRLGGDDAYLRLSKDKQIITNATKTKINGVTCEYNTPSDCFIMGDGTRHVALNKNGELRVGDGNGAYDLVLARKIYSGQWTTSWVYMTNDLLIQGGLATVGDVLTNVTLPRPYQAKNTYILYVSDNNEAGTLSDWAVAGKRVSNTTIGLRYFTDRQVAWLTIGGRN